jgi:predicted DNA-binding protein
MNQIRISFVASKELNQRLEKASKENQITKSLFIRSVIWDFLNKNQSDLKQ